MSLVPQACLSETPIIPLSQTSAQPGHSTVALHSKVASNCASRTTPAKCKQLSAGSPCRCPRAWLLGWRLVVAFLTRPHTLIFLVSSFTCVPLYHSAVQAPNCPPPPPPLHPLCCIIAVHHVGPVTMNSFECQPAIGAQPPTIQSTFAW